MLSSIPSGVILYRGSFREASESKSFINKPPNYMKNRPYFFLYDNNGKNIANRAYGQVTVLQTINKVKLINMGDPRSIQMLLQHTNDPKIIKSIMKSFRISNNNQVVRKSTLEHDVAVVNFICTLGLDGFWTPKLRQKYGNKKFHQEIVLCHPKKHLRVVKVENATRPPPIAAKKRTLVKNYNSEPVNFNSNWY